ncbi:MAG TPA: beta-propeller fold lactonase family protein [Actinomycetota bacterium]|nr:beta-propeller fold lactonase family protein [Actinomycetota bacterium]
MPEHTSARTRSIPARRLLLTVLLGALVVLPSATAGGAPLVPAGAVFVLSNAVSGNDVIAFARAADGSLTAAGSFATGGLGTGAITESQGSVVVSPDHRLLFAVDAGSDQITSFRIALSGLTRVSTVASGGDFPVSLTYSPPLLYVLNAGAPEHITGFVVGSGGGLRRLSMSSRLLSGTNVGASQIEFTPDGTKLVVTERNVQTIDVFTLDPSTGRPTGRVTNPSAGIGPFGFGFTSSGTLIVSEAQSTPTGGDGAVSSYAVASNGTLSAVTASSTTHQLATCWIAVTPDDAYAYATNAESDTVTGYAVDGAGALTPLDSDGITAAAGDHPLDEGIAGGHLYVLQNLAGSIGIFAIGADGSLTGAGGPTGLPVGSAVGIAAF